MVVTEWLSGKWIVAHSACLVWLVGQQACWCCCVSLLGVIFGVSMTISQKARFEKQPGCWVEQILW